jgi:hypothetical protein
MEQLTRRRVENLCANRHLYDHICSFAAVSIRSLAMAAAFGPVFRIISKVQKCVEAFVRLKPDIAAFSAVAARGPAARNELLTAKRRNAVSPVAGLYKDLYAIDKHRDYLI